VTGALSDYVAESLAQSRQLVEGGNGETIPPDELLRRAQAVARDLSPLEPGEPVLAAFANAPADLVGMLGIWLAGGVVVPKPAGALAATAQQLQEATGARLRVHGRDIERIATAPPAARELLREAALVLFTSGSTGQPKGVVIGHDRMAGKLGVLGRLLNLAPTDCVVVPLRLTFVFGLWVSMLVLRSGARLVLIDKVTRESLAKALGDGATVLGAVPTMLRSLLASGAVRAPALRAILTGGETLGVKLAADLSATLPRTDVYDLYGLTETGSCDFCLPPAEHADGAGSIGWPTEQVAFRILGVDGRPTPDGTSGELCVATPFGMLGYLDNPDLTAGSFDEGYFRTGDLARQRRDGRVEIVGRLKDIVSRGGNKVAPAEIDAVLSAHPDVAAALCAGAPDARLGEAIHAIVVAKPGTSLTAEALRAWAAERIERYKLPDAIHFRDALPLGSTGKVARSRVAEIVLGQRDG
jgi:long-chain acyl-CoA synthetase